MSSRTFRRLFFRTLALFLGFSLALSDPSFALRQESPRQAGVEEQLREKLIASGLEEFQKVPIDEVLGLRQRLQEANRQEVYQDRLVRKGKRYYLVKTEEPNPERNRSPWPEKNKPIRAYTVFRILRALGCNVCDIEIPSLEERKQLSQLTGADPETLYLVGLSTNYDRDDPEVIQKDPQKELTRRIFGSFLVRSWDPHVNNTGPLRQNGNGQQANSPAMMFDADEALHREMSNREYFLFLFARHYMDQTSLVDLERSTREDRGESLVLRTNPAILAEQIDPEEAEQFVQDADHLNLRDLEEDVLHTLFERYEPERHDEIADTIGQFFSNLSQWQADFPLDAPWFVEALFDGFSYGSIAVFANVPRESEADFIRKRGVIEVALAQVRNELIQQLSAGLEEGSFQELQTMEINQPGVVVLEVDQLQEASVEWPLLLSRLGRFSGYTILLGGEAMIEGWRALNPELRIARTPEELRSDLEELMTTDKVGQVTFMGSQRGAEVVRPIVSQMRLGFSAQAVSIFQLLAGLGVPADFATRLATGLEESTAFELAA